MSDNDKPYRLYLFHISYFSGKMQAYLRYKRIPHVGIEPDWWKLVNHIYPHTGLMKVPVVETPDGEWLQDTSPMIEWFESRYPASPVIPDDPALAFLSHLIEDYADEWLWRPALHYRWYYREDARLLSRRFAETFLRVVPLPTAVVASWARLRQWLIYQHGDGVTADTVPHIESIYLRNLDWLQAIFEKRPFLLGDHPSLADFGYFASMFRHFSLDPTPSRLMRDRAPAVYEWVARMWNAEMAGSGNSAAPGAWPQTLPDDFAPILADISSAYLPYLHANALAWKRGLKKFTRVIQGVRYEDLPVVQYRVWCRERLLERYEALPAEARRTVDATLTPHGGLEALAAGDRVESGLHATPPPVCHARRVGLPHKLWLFLTGTHWNVPGQRLS